MLLKNYHLLLRLASSLLLAHFFAVAGQPYPPEEIMTKKGYLPALLIGAFVTLLISYLLTSLTRLLNRTYPWDNYQILRPGLQILGGILLPSLIIFALMTLYFGIAGIWVLDTDWLKHCGGYIIVALVIGNVGSEILAARLGFISTLKDEIVEMVINPEQLTTRFKGQLISDLTHIIAINRRNFAMFADGIKHRFPYTIGHAMALLNAGTHIRVNRSEIIKFSNIERVHYFGVDKSRIRIYLKGNNNEVIISSEKYTTPELKAMLHLLLSIG
jgi:hypothetical protein